MTDGTNDSGAKPDGLSSCWIIRSPDGENTLKDEDFGTVMGFSTKAFATDFGNAVIGVGEFKCEEWFWANLVVLGLQQGYNGVTIDYVHGDPEKNVFLFSPKTKH